MSAQYLDPGRAGQVHTAISRATTSRDLTVETVEGDGFVAVRKTDEPAPARESNHHLGTGSDDGVGHPSARSYIAPVVRRRWTDWDFTASAADSSVAANALPWPSRFAREPAPGVPCAGVGPV